MERFISLIQETSSIILPQIFNYLNAPIRDDEIIIRQAAENSCKTIGIYISSIDIIDLLIPRINGVLNGMDTSSHRKLSSHLHLFYLFNILISMLLMSNFIHWIGTNAIRLLTHCIQGFPLQLQFKPNSIDVSSILIAIGNSLSQTNL